MGIDRYNRYHDSKVTDVTELTFRLGKWIINNQGNFKINVMSMKVTDKMTARGGDYLSASSQEKHHQRSNV